MFTFYFPRKVIWRNGIIWQLKFARILPTRSRSGEDIGGEGSGNRYLGGGEGIVDMKLSHNVYLLFSPNSYLTKRNFCTIVTYFPRNVLWWNGIFRSWNLIEYYQTQPEVVPTKTLGETTIYWICRPFSLNLSTLANDWGGDGNLQLKIASCKGGNDRNR